MPGRVSSTARPRLGAGQAHPRAPHLAAPQEPLRLTTVTKHTQPSPATWNGSGLLPAPQAGVSRLPGTLLRRLPGPSELWVCHLPPTLWSALHDQVQQFTGKKKNRPEGLLVTCQPILPNSRLGAKRPGSASSEAKPSVTSVSTSPAAWAPASLLPPLPAEVALPLLVLGAQAPVGGRSDPETPTRNTHLQGCRSPRR